MTEDEDRALREENAKLRDVLHRAREAMILLAALAGSRANDGIPFSQIDKEARSLGA